MNEGQTISVETDLDSLDGMAMVRNHDEIERLGILRTDLKALLSFTGSKDLSAALKILNINHVLEIGVADRFEALISIYKALANNKDFFPANLVASDPKIDEDVYPEQKTFVHNMTRRKQTLRTLLDEMSGKFDLVLAKGVISIGAGTESEPSTYIDDTLNEIALSLNQNNQNALAVISSKTGLVLPFGTKTLAKAGLKPVFRMSPTRQDVVGGSWEKILLRQGRIDPQPFKLVICKKI